MKSPIAERNHCSGEMHGSIGAVPDKLLDRALLATGTSGKIASTLHSVSIKPSFVATGSKASREGTGALRERLHEPLP